MLLEPDPDLACEADQNGHLVVGCLTTGGSFSNQSLRIAPPLSLLISTACIHSEKVMAGRN